MAKAAKAAKAVDVDGRRGRAQIEGTDLTVVMVTHDLYAPAPASIIRALRALWALRAPGGGIW